MYDEAMLIPKTHIGHLIAKYQAPKEKVAAAEKTGQLFEYLFRR